MKGPRCILFILLLGLSSCKREAPKIKLNREERVRLDTLFKNQVPEINAFTDSLCTNFRKNQYQRIKDSIITIRLQEIDQIAPVK